MAWTLLTREDLPAQQQHHRLEEGQISNRGQDAHGRILGPEMLTLQIGLNTTYNVFYERSAAATRLADAAYFENSIFDGGMPQQHP